MPTLKLTAEEHLILFVAALGINSAAAGITARRMRAMLVRGLIERDNAGKYKLTVAGREAFATMLRNAGFETRMTGGHVPCSMRRPRRRDRLSVRCRSRGSC